MNPFNLVLNKYDTSNKPNLVSGTIVIKIEYIPTINNTIIKAIFE